MTPLKWRNTLSEELNFFSSKNHDRFIQKQNNGTKWIEFEDGNQSKIYIEVSIGKDSSGYPIVELMEEDTKYRAKFTEEGSFSVYSDFQFSTGYWTKKIKGIEDWRFLRTFQIEQQKSFNFYRLFCSSKYF